MQKTGKNDFARWVFYIFLDDTFFSFMHSSGSSCMIFPLQWTVNNNNKLLF